jgi:pre-mRNA-splicing helicase BRR2
VAVLTILHELGLHRKQDGSIDTSAFKIVYVAPMKALVAEMVGNFSTRLGEAYGLKVRELTGALCPQDAPPPGACVAVFGLSKGL